MAKPKITRFTGDVVRKRIAPGSKSDREAVVLVTPKTELLLRRRGGNPFRDDELTKLVGKHIHCRGLRMGQTLILTEWEVR